MDVANLTIKADSSSVRTAQKDLGNFGSKAGLAGSAMRKLAPILAGVLSARLFIGLANQAKEFNTALGEVSTLLDNAAQEMPILEQNAKDLAATFGSSPTAQAQAFYQAISAGASNATDATAMLTAANKLAIGGVTDVTTAVDGLTSIVNAFGLEASQAADVSDAMFVAMRAGKTTIAELSGSVGKVAALASTAGLSFEEMLGSVSALTTGGIATSEAVTGLKAALTNILKPSKEAADMAEALGLEFNMQSIQAKGLQGFLKDLVRQTGGNQQAMLKLFGSTEALNTVFALTGAQAETFDGIMEGMADSAGQTDKAFGKMSQTMEQKLAILKGKFAATAVEVGNFVLKATEPIVDHLNVNFDAYSQYWKNLKTQASTMLSQIWKIWSPFFGNITKGFKAALKFYIDLIGPWVTRIGEWIAVLAEFYFNLYKNITIGAEEAIRKFINFFREGFISAREFIEVTKTKIIGFYETLKAKAQGFFESSEETERKLAAIDQQRRDSLAEINEKYDEQRNELVLLSEEAVITNQVFDAMEGTIDALAGGIEGFADATVELTDDLVDVTAQNARFQAGLVAAASSVGVLRNQVANTNTPVITLRDGTELLTDSLFDLNTGLTNSASDTGGFRVVTQEMETMATNSAAVNATLREMDEDADSAADSVADLTFEQKTFNTAVENTQTKFANLIEDTILSGKANFKDFFKGVIDGWKKMIAEIMAKKLMDAIFGQGGISGFLKKLTGGFSGVFDTIKNSLGSIFSGLANTLGKGLSSIVSGIGSAISGVLGGGSAAAATTAASTAATTAAGSAAAGAAGGAAAAGGATGMFAGLKGSLATLGSKAWAFMTNPITLAVAAAAVIAKLLDPSGTMSHNAGFLTQDVEQDPNRKFHIGTFASGAQFFGFRRRATAEEAMTVVDSFRAIDDALTDLARKAGLKVNLKASDFIGYDEKGGGTGAFFGSAFEDGGSKGTPLEDQHLKFAKRWLTLVAGDNQTDPKFLQQLMGAGDISTLGQMILGQADGSHAGGINSIPFDGYIAELHKGERVQTAAEAQRSDAMIDEIITLRSNLNDLMLVVAKAVNKSARIEQRWDVIGLPPTRS